jgi:predicted ATP-dependent serine protease
MNKTINEHIDKLKELGEKKHAIETAKINWQYEDLEKREREHKAFSNLRIAPLSKEGVDRLIHSNREYIELARTGSVFLGIDDFDGVVPMFARNIIFVAAKTGTGKSTTSANITLQAIRQNKRVLVITNEENPTDILNRIIFNLRGWHYSDHRKITPEQQAEMDKMYPLLNQRISIVDDGSNGVGGTTTTLEGIEAILSTLKQEEVKYDVIIIDYIQNIISSLKIPSLDQWKVIDRVGKMLDQFKSHYNAPIIVMSQLKEGDAPFKERIEKCKSFLNSVTCAIEIDTDFEAKTTSWTIRKARFNGTNGKVITTGFDKGRYVKYDVEFEIKAQADKLRKDLQAKQVENGNQLQSMIEKMKQTEQV